RNIHRLGRQADPAPDFSEGEQAEIRVAVRARIAAAGQIHRLETRKLHQPRGERVECAGRHDVAVPRDQRPEYLALLHDGPRSVCMEWMRKCFDAVLAFPLNCRKLTWRMS